MNMIIFLPSAFGPYDFRDLLSMFSSIFFWKSPEVVLDEKLIFKKTYCSELIWSKAALTVIVLAAPEKPQNITGFLLLTIVWSNHEYLVVSMVGTRMEPNFLSAGG